MLSSLGSTGPWSLEGYLANMFLLAPGWIFLNFHTMAQTFFLFLGGGESQHFPFSFEPIYKCYIANMLKMMNMVNLPVIC